MATIALARHFFENAAGRAWLDEEGIEAMRGVFFSALAGLASLGFFLPRQFRKQYVELGGMADPAPYRQALLSDTLFMICLPTLVTALVAVLLAPVMFPDEVDHATLTPLPLTRGQIFSAKVIALAALLVTLVGGMVALFSIAFPAFTQTPWSQASLAGRVAAHASASAASAAFAFLGVVSIQGLVLLLTPRRLLHAISATLQCVLVALLVLAVPLVFRLPQTAAWVAGEPPLLWPVPPAWFLGLEQVLLGTATPYWRELAGAGGIAIAAVTTVAIGCYAVLYRNFERIVLRQDRARAAVGPATPRPASPVDARVRASAPWRGVWEFATKTLRRNRLSQMLFLVSWAAGAAVVMNNLMDDLFWRWLQTGGRPPQYVTRAAATMPMAMIVMAVIGLRASFLLPANSRANWIFRLLDLPERRRGHLAAVHRAFVRLAVAPALAVAAPLQLIVLGPWQTLGAATLAGAFGLVIVELVLPVHVHVAARQTAAAAADRSRARRTPDPAVRQRAHSRRNPRPARDPDRWRRAAGDCRGPRRAAASHLRGAAAAVRGRGPGRAADPRAAALLTARSARVYNSAGADARAASWGARPVSMYVFMRTSSAVSRLSRSCPIAAAAA